MTPTPALQALSNLLHKLQRLTIHNVDGEAFNQDLNWLFDRIVNIGTAVIGVDIDNVDYNIVAVLEDDTAFAVYDYHEVFNEIAREIRDAQ